MKILLLSFCLFAVTQLKAQDGVPIGPSNTPSKTDTNSSAFIMGALFSEAKPSKEDVDFFTKLFFAIQKKDYNSFVADGEPAFKALPEDKFDSVATQLSS
jgi:hypothetical protein